MIHRAGACGDNAELDCCYYHKTPDQWQSIFLTSMHPYSAACLEISQIGGAWSFLVGINSRRLREEIVFLAGWRYGRFSRVVKKLGQSGSGFGLDVFLSTVQGGSEEWSIEVISCEEFWVGPCRD